MSASSLIEKPIVALNSPMATDETGGAFRWVARDRQLSPKTGPSDMLTRLVADRQRVGIATNAARRVSVSLVEDVVDRRQLRDHPIVQQRIEGLGRALNDENVAAINAPKWSWCF
jgi:hypothetical protein